MKQFQSFFLGLLITLVLLGSIFNKAQLSSDPPGIGSMINLIQHA